MGINAARKEDEKRRKYLQALNAVRIDFRPFAVETYGAIAPSASRTIDEFATLIARSRGENLALHKKRLYVNLSIVLQRNNAEMIISRVRALHALIVPPPAR